jgi:hypothetical protein
MHFMALGQVLKDVVMPGRYWMVDIILGRNEEDLHMPRIIIVINLE